MLILFKVIVRIESSHKFKIHFRTVLFSYTRAQHVLCNHLSTMPFCKTRNFFNLSITRKVYQKAQNEYNCDNNYELWAPDKEETLLHILAMDVGGDHISTAEFLVNSSFKEYYPNEKYA